MVEVASSVLELGDELTLPDKLVSVLVVDGSVTALLVKLIVSVLLGKKDVSVLLTTVLVPVEAVGFVLLADDERVTELLDELE